MHNRHKMSATMGAQQAQQWAHDRHNNGHMTGTIMDTMMLMTIHTTMPVMTHAMMLVMVHVMTPTTTYTTNALEPFSGAHQCILLTSP
jgi:hypothetical protein